MALAVTCVAVGGVAAADRPQTAEPIHPTPQEPADGGDMGVCVVGADSPCNGASADNGTAPTHPTPINDSERLGDGDGENEQILLPEDQNRDGDIDERFGGDGEQTNSDAGTELGSGETDDSQLWIPEDQNRDGEIDDRFLGAFTPGPVDLLPSLVTPF
jgi:hypothetical protein